MSTSVASATGGNFESLNVDTTAASTTLTDDSDVTTVSLSATSSVSEDGGVITYTATLTNPAEGAVTVTLSDGYRNHHCRRCHGGYGGCDGRR